MGNHESKALNSEAKLQGIVPSSSSTKGRHNTPPETLSSDTDQFHVPTIATTTSCSLTPDIVPETIRKIEKLNEFSTICSEIEPCLFVGGQSVATNQQVLQQYGITHIVNCASLLIPSTIPEITYFNIALSDGVGESIEHWFYLVFDFIEAAHMNAKNHKILVHCQQGVSRSCTFVIGYLMWKRNYRFQKAFDIVKGVRSICSPNSGFIAQLLHYEHKLFDQPPSPQLYRLARHSPFEPNLVIKECFAPNTRKQAVVTKTSDFHPKGCFLVLNSATSEIFVYQGMHCALADIEHLCRKHIERINTYERRQLSAQKIYFLDKGSASEQLNNFLSSCLRPTLSIEQLLQPNWYDEDYNDPKDGATAVSSKLDEIVKEPSEEVSFPNLFMFPVEDIQNWEKLGEYDSDDLLEDYLFLLEHSSLSFFVWYGQNQEIPSETKVKKLVQLVYPSYDPTTLSFQAQQQDHESEEFWTSFEQGY